MSGAAADDELAVYLVVNGPLGMSAGKIAAQAFQAAQRLFAAAPAAGPAERAALTRWQSQGTRTITRVAETPHVFERVCAEVPGVVMVDEGLTEVEPDSATIFASWPLVYRNPPRALRHRRCPLLRAPGSAGAREPASAAPQPRVGQVRPAAST